VHYSVNRKSEIAERANTWEGIGEGACNVRMKSFCAVMNILNAMYWQGGLIASGTADG
jgi:hypothetical protein